MSAHHSPGDRPQSISHPQQIAALWTVFLLGLIFHTQLGLMPLFHGINVAHEHLHDTSSTSMSLILWLMLGFFLLPTIAIVGTVFLNSLQFRRAHFTVTVIYSVMNLLHVIADLQVHPIEWYQILLMVFLLGIGLLLNGVAFAWMRDTTALYPSTQHPPHKLSEH